MRVYVVLCAALLLFAAPASAEGVTPSHDYAPVYKPLPDGAFDKVLIKLGGRRYKVPKVYIDSLWDQESWRTIDAIDSNTVSFRYTEPNFKRLVEELTGSGVVHDVQPARVQVSYNHYEPSPTLDEYFTQQAMRQQKTYLYVGNVKGLRMYKVQEKGATLYLGLRRGRINDIVLCQRGKALKYEATMNCTFTFKHRNLSFVTYFDEDEIQAWQAIKRERINFLEQFALK